jgi:hypothetical protein
MRKTLTVLLTLTLIVGSAGLVTAQDPYPGVVSVDSVQAHPSESVAVKVWLRNNTIDVSALTLPLKFSSSALELDSVSLNNAVWGAGFAGYFVIDNSDRTVRITVLPDDMVYPLPAVSFTDGVIAELYFSIAAGVTPHHVTVDSIYTDSSLGNDVHIYTRIDISDNSGTGVFLPDFVPGDIEILVPTDVEDDGFGLGLPDDFALSQNYPNPFNPTTTIMYSLPRAGNVKLNVFNILGQQVTSLVDGHRVAGTHVVDFDGANMPSGIYFYRLQYDGGSTTRKMTLVK